MTKNQADFKDLDVPRRSLDQVTPEEWDKAYLDSLARLQDTVDRRHQDLHDEIDKLIVEAEKHIRGDT